MAFWFALLFVVMKFAPTSQTSQPMRNWQVLPRCRRRYVRARHSHRCPLASLLCVNVCKCVCGLLHSRPDCVSASQPEFLCLAFVVAFKLSVNAGYIRIMRVGSVGATMHDFVRRFLGACVRTLVCVCVRACVRACVCARVHMARVLAPLWS
jgi:hypothetical protein